MPKNKVKLNDKLNDKTNKKRQTIKTDKYISEESREVRNFVIILMGIIIIVLIVYGVSRIFIKEESPIPERTVQAGKIDYDKISIGTLLNRNNSEYYVALYDAEEPKAVTYSAVITKYLENEDAIKVYFCDLSNPLNSDYYVGEDGTTNPDAQDISQLALGDLTLIKVENGKIVKYLEGFDAMKAEFEK